MLCAKKSPRELAWELMLEKKSFSVREVYKACSMSQGQVSSFVQQLLRKECIRKVKITKNSRDTRYEIVNGNKPSFLKGLTNSSARVPSVTRQRMWNSIRVLRKFDIPDVMMAAEVKRNTVSRFFVELSKAGYIRKIHPRGAKQGDRSVFILCRNTGPIAPIARKKLGMWDENEQKLYEAKESL